MLNLKNKEKKKDTGIWLGPMTKAHIPTENSQHKNATKNFDYTTIRNDLEFFDFFGVKCSALEFS